MYVHKSFATIYAVKLKLSLATGSTDADLNGHHTLQIPAETSPFTCTAAGNRSIADTVATIEYCQYDIATNDHNNLLEVLRKAFKHGRNAQYLGYESASAPKKGIIGILIVTFL